jgi:hypothetical protein
MRCTAEGVWRCGFGERWRERRDTVLRATEGHERGLTIARGITSEAPFLAAVDKVEMVTKALARGVSGYAKGYI